MEEKFNAHPKVGEATIIFSTRQLHLTAENPESLIPELQALARTVESDVVITPREEYKGDSGGETCGHDHPQNMETSEKMPEQTLLIYGAVLFAAGLIMDHFGGAGMSLICCVIA